jgi:hypothetical protein
MIHNNAKKAKAIKFGIVIAIVFNLASMTKISDLDMKKPPSN